MARPFDISKLRRSTSKSIPGITYGFNDPETWVDTGCYVLNYLISNRFDGGFPLEGKFTMFAGDSGCLPESAMVRIRIPNHSNIFGANDSLMTVGDLKSLYQRSLVNMQIDTPDGFQDIVAWFDKGPMPVVTVVTRNGATTRCATNHAIQLVDGDWLHADRLEVGDLVITEFGVSDVINVVKHRQEEQCYDFTVNHPNHRYWGDGFSSHNSGKSYIATANTIRYCQKNNIWPIMIDSENALDQNWLDKLGDIDTSMDGMDKFSVAMVNDTAALLGTIIDDYRLAQGSKPYKDRQKMIIIIDSIGMLITPTQEQQFVDGDMKGDMGIKAKQITNMLRVFMGKIADQPIGLVATNHVFDAQDQYKPDSIPGGKMLEFASSVIVQMNKYTLKEDENGTKLTDGAVAGIRSTAVVRKSRYAKPFEKVKIDIPWESGMDPYSGLFDLFEKKGVVKKTGNRYSYTSPVTGEEITEWRKNFKKEGILDTIMREWSHWENPTVKMGFDETGTENMSDGDFDE